MLLILCTQIMELNHEANVSPSECQSDIDTTDVVGDFETRITSPLQITSIDGFFNRKRGRPPKNRFVEVYKTAQQPPQAIFTSFKLEKSDLSPLPNVNTADLSVSGASTDILCDHDLSQPYTRKRSLAPRTTTKATATATTTTTTTTSAAAAITTTTTAAAATATATTTETTHETLKEAEPNQKYQRIKSHQNPAIETKRDTKITADSTAELDYKQLEEQQQQATNFLSQGARQQLPHSLFIKHEINKPHNSSVVRAAGTFYPENSYNLIEHSTGPEYVSANSYKSPLLKSNYLIHCPISKRSVQTDQPEDLSMKIKVSLASDMQTKITVPTTTTVKTYSENSTVKQTHQLEHLFNMYQQQLLFPRYMYSLMPNMEQENSSEQPVYMSTFLEHATKQKLFLFNMAVMATAAATANYATYLSASNSNDIGRSATYMNGEKRKRDHTIPTGYRKFRFNEDCGFDQCGYRNHQSHFHCNRHDCHYSFCDKSRFVQHTARHERLDTLMGDDFLQFRANMNCENPTCPYALSTALNKCEAVSTLVKKSSHFHCRKCDYVCADTNKVVAHRRLHSKMEYIQSTGFRKVASNESCLDTSCSYALKHTHYHCLSCDCSVLSRAQLSSHKHKSVLQSATVTGSDNRTIASQK